MGANKSLSEFTRNIPSSFDNENIIKIDYSLLKDKKKSLGQNFTSQIIVDFMISLSHADMKAKALEPSAGEGIFIRRLKNKGFTNIVGCEIDPILCKESNDILKIDG